MKKLSTQEFISKCIEIYGDAYDYSDTVYKSSKEPVTIICKVHGHFSKPPNLLLAKKSGCPKCGNAKKGQHNKLSGEDTLKELAAKYPNYAPFILKGPYTRNTDKVYFTCAVHGEQVSKISYIKMQEQETPCPVCNVETSYLKRRLSQTEYIADCNKVHNNRYDYSLTSYTTSQDKITVVCSKHGQFEVGACAHKLGTGCAKCYHDSKKGVVLEYSKWLARARVTHGDTYEYYQETYRGTSEKVKILCKQHGEFWQLGNDHTAGSRCPTCASVSSVGQKELAEFIEGLGFEVLKDYRIGAGKLEVDCYIPSTRLAVEYDGLKWHSTQHREPNYHSKKRNLLAARGIDLVRVFEDEWQTKSKQVKSLLKMRLAKGQAKLHARKCSIVEVTNEQAREFYSENHIQGWRRTGIHKGLRENGRLIAVMTFTKTLSERGVATQNEKIYELARFASSERVAGGASKLFKALVESTAATSVISYSDDRLFTGKMYEAIGFSMHSKVSPSYTYWKSGNKIRLHKSHFRHNRLPSVLGEQYNPNLTERANCEAAGYYQVYDCGLTKWLWQPNT